jgi:hypothetical protein
VIILFAIFVMCTMYYQGGVYMPSKHSTCATQNQDPSSSSTAFCDIKIIDLACPPKIKNTILDLIENKELGKYVSIPNWKGGRTIPTQECIDNFPDLVHFYHSLTPLVSKHIGAFVSTTPLYLPTSCAVLVYERENDFINWHYDVNYYKGRFFTLLIPVSDEPTCTKFMYKDVKGRDVPVDIRGSTSVLFEGEHVFHMASKLCKGQRRVIISLQFVTTDAMSLTSKAMARLKDIAFIGGGKY